MKNRTAPLQRRAVPRPDFIAGAAFIQTLVPQTRLLTRPRLAGLGLVLLLGLPGGALHAASIIQFSAATYSVTEGTAQVEILVQRTGDPGTAVSVDFSTRDLVANAGMDYLEVSTHLTFQLGVTNLIVAVPILNDGLVEGIEMFQVGLSNPAGGAELGARSTATVRITSNDTGFRVEFASYQVHEDEGSVLIGVLRGDDGDFPAIVEYTTSDVSAKAGEDYVLTHGQLSYAAGETLKLLTVPIVKDGLKELNEAFRLTLTNATGTVLANPMVATITIVDNDPGVQFEFDSYWVQEHEGALTLRVVRGNDHELGAFTVDYRTTDLTATAGEDYNETKGILEFAASETEKTLSIPIIRDESEEPDEEVTVTLSNSTDAGALGKTNRATITILDTTGFAPHHFAGISAVPQHGIQLTLGGGVPRRFREYFDLYPVEVSTDLVKWTPLATLHRTNSLAAALTWLDPGAADDGQRFYRTVANSLSTPLPKPAGPFPVGVVSRFVHDPSRRNRYFVSTNGSFMAAIWYPAVATPGKLPVPYQDQRSAREIKLRMPASRLDRVLYAVSHSLPEAECTRQAAPCPVVLYSHGWTGDFVAQVVAQAEHLASHGYVVVSMSHFDASLTRFPDGTYRFGDLREASRTDTGLRDRVRDVRVVLDELVRWNEADPILRGRLDVTKVAGMGYSWGGGVVGEIGRTDDRVRGIILLDAYLQNAPELNQFGFSKPLIGIYSSEGGGNTILFDKATRDAVYLLLINSFHYNFGDSYWWEVPNADLIGGREIARTVHAYSLWFLNKYLRSSDEPLPRQADYPRVSRLKQK